MISPVRESPARQLPPAEGENKPTASHYATQPRRPVRHPVWCGMCGATYFWRLCSLQLNLKQTASCRWRPLSLWLFAPRLARGLLSAGCIVEHEGIFFPSSCSASHAKGRTTRDAGAFVPIFMFRSIPIDPTHALIFHTVATPTQTHARAPNRGLHVLPHRLGSSHIHWDPSQKVVQQGTCTCHQPMGCTSGSLIRFLFARLAQEKRTDKLKEGETQTRRKSNVMFMSLTVFCWE
jgi:hypothetical protein